MKKIITTGEKETFELAEKYARQLRGGEIIGLLGDLGAGKTVFAKGIAAGLGVKNAVNSPTFVIMKIYQARKSDFGIRNFCHIDAYRISNPEEIIAIGAKEYFSRQDTVTVIEWADKIKKILPRKTRLIKLKILVKERQNSRKIILS